MGWLGLRAAAASVAFLAGGCAALPEWPGSNGSEAAAGPVAYPDLAQLPERPADLTGPAAREGIAQSLAADRGRNEEAAARL